MNKKPFFSVILPIYNRADKLKQSLQTLKKQTLKDFEVIVCDDGSTDNTKEIIDSFLESLNIIHLKEDHWGGPARPRNKGISIAKGEYVAFLDSDDGWYPQKLESVKKSFGDNDIIYHDLDICRDNGIKTFKKVKCRHLKQPVFIDLMRNGNALFTSGVVIRKNIIIEAGGFVEDKALVSVEDFDLWLSIARITEKFCYIPKSLGFYRIDKKNISRPTPEQVNRIMNVYIRNLPFLENSDREQAKMMMSYLLARTKQKIGRNDEAVGYLKKSIKSNNKGIKFRSLFWLIILTFLRNKNA